MQLSGWLSRGIPDLSARTAGVFRIVFGVLLLGFFWSRPVDSDRLRAIFDPQVEGEVHAAVMAWLQAHPAATDLVMPALLATGAAFTAGLFTRLTFGLFVAFALVWSYPAVAFDSTHPHSTLMLTLVALLPSRWGDAWSIDAWRRRGGGVPAGGSGPRYGYSVWVPGLVCGIAFAAAAWAKLDTSGIAWILNGSVKYHFITDSAAAPVDWGLKLAGSPGLAVLASFAAVAIEAVAITAAFSRSEVYRLLIGAGALALLLGFRLFMGVFWPGWWILLLGFLPWGHLDRLAGRRWSLPPAAGAPLSASAPQLALIVLACAQQVVISALEIERAPMFTNYPMYRNTFASPQAFDAAAQPYSRLVVGTERGPLELSCNAGEDLVEELRAALDGSPEAAASIWRAVEGCQPGLSGANEVRIEQDLRTFDWTALTFRTRRAVAVIGPLRRIALDSSAATAP